ncbi:carbohydrate ABC transporter substrate-binding protein [Glaciecola sp. MH2013]|nr:carbohydrate ABC transporter substrate-binding protein [Glaciecola sp. MH2013]
MSFFCASFAQAENIEVGILMTAGPQKSSYLKHAQDFEKMNPGITLELKFYSDAEFKKALPSWLARKDGPKVLSWQGGRRLFQFVEKNQITDLSDFWAKHDLTQVFSQSSLGAIKLDDKPYGVPISYYQWGFYYRASLFQDLSLQAPTNWEEFLAVCEALKKAGVKPISIGAKNKWTSAAWFDYLNLRINGLDFHQRLLQGNESFKSDKVRKVFEHWNVLLENDYFVDKFDDWDWQQAMPFTYHKMAGMTLIGNFFAGAMPAKLKDDFRFFPFPIINAELEIYEEAPLDIFMVPSYARLTPGIESYLLSLASVDFQQSYNESAGMISPNVDAKPSSDYFIAEGQALLQRAKGVSQFFDRDTNAAMAGAATAIFTDYMRHRDVERVTSELERAGQQHL